MTQQGSGSETCPSCGHAWYPRHDAWGEACGICGHRPSALGGPSLPAQHGFTEQPSPQQAGFGPQGQQGPSPSGSAEGGSTIAQAADPRSMVEVFAQFDEQTVAELTPDHPDVQRVVAEYRKQRVNYMAQLESRGKKKKQENGGGAPEEKKVLDVRDLWKV